VLNDKTRNRRRSAWLGLLTVFLLALATAGYGLSSSPSASTGPDKTGSSATSSTAVLAPEQLSGSSAAGSTKGGGGGSGDTFGVIVGHAQTLYPSLTQALPVTYSNPNSFDILVKTYRVTVSVPAAQATACPASSLQVPSGTITLSPTLAVARNSAVSITVPIKLAASAPTGCQRVAFTISVDATAVKK
jgi:hypothetical protein